MGSSPKGESDEIQREDANSNSTHSSFPQIHTVSGGETVNIFSFTSSHRGLLQSSGPLDGVEGKSATQKKPKRNLARFFIRPPTRAGFLKLGSPTLLVSPSKTIQRIAEERDEISRATPTPAPTEPVHGLKEGFNMPFVGEVRWAALNRVMKNWLRNPKNLALLIWGTAVAVSGAILFMVMIGLLNSALPHKRQRDAWFEVNNQILNALFTLMCLYQHPQRFYHLALLCRWGPDDIIKVRKIYCKNGTYKPHEWAHMMVVVMLLHVNCFAQYALCGLNWGYKRSDRPAVGVGLCLAVAIGAPAIAGLYVILSPLGRDYEADIDLEAGISNDAELAAASDDLAAGKQMSKLLEKRYSFVDRGSKRMEPKPEWKGGLFDCWVYFRYLRRFSLEIFVRCVRTSSIQDTASPKFHHAWKRFHLGISPVCQQSKSSAFSPAVNSPTWVYAGLSPLNDQALRSSAESPMGQSSLLKGSSGCFSPF